MSSRIDYYFDVLVIGGGPAGMAAAHAAAAHARVAIVDENPALGGQIWRSALHEPSPAIARAWRSKVEQQQISVLRGMRIFAAPEKGVLHAEGKEGLCILRYRKLILATGARERFLPFPGWTLRGVIGAGGLQALVKAGLDVASKRVVIAGSGPLLLAVAAYLRNHGAQVLMICEQAPLQQLAGFSVSLLPQPQKLAEALRYRWKLRGVPYRIGWWAIAAHGKNGQLNSVTLTNGTRQMKVSCDLLACGFHLVPNTEIPALLGCAAHEHGVEVNPLQESTVSGLYCAGEGTGIGGLDKSLVEGAIAGYASSGQLEKAKALQSRRNRAIRFARAMQQGFALRNELRQLCAHDTLVCRCEDIRYENLREHSSWRAAKLQTRCGMGPCQGRVCGTATSFLFGWHNEAVRPPAVPVRFDTLAGVQRNSSPHSQTE